MPVLTRRALLASAAGAALAAPRSWPMGANTAIDGYELHRAVNTVRELGFPCIEIHPMGKPEATVGKYPGFEFDKLPEPERRRLKKALRGFRHVTTHLPYTGWNWMSADAAVKEASVRAVETAMEATAYFGAKLAVLHPQTLPEGRETALWPEYLDRLKKWGDRAQRLGFRIALETGYPKSIKDYTRLIAEIGHTNVGSTLDVGHQGRYTELVARVKPEARATPQGIRAYNDTNIEIVERLGSKLFHLHVHDIDPATWQEHKPLVHGFVDYPRLFAALRKGNYGGILMFEIGGPAADVPGWLREGKRKMADWMAAA